MTSVLRGLTTTLPPVTWVQYAGGPAVDVAGLTITIKRLSDNTVIVGPTSTGVVHVATGLYTYAWATAVDLLLGDYAAIWATGDGHQATDVITVTAGGVSVTLQDVLEYLEDEVAAQYAVASDDSDDPTLTYPAIEHALAAEKRAQAGRVQYPADVDGLADLCEALMRRVQRNLAMRKLPLAMVANPDSGTVSRPGGRDPEIRRIENAYPKTAVG